MERQRRNFIAVSGLGALAGIVPQGGGAEAAPVVVPLGLTPQVTEGPFYLDVGLVRADITEGLKGVPVEVRIRLVDVGNVPLAGVRVDLWHCDAAGLYSGFDGQGPGRAITMRGRTFLRGTVLCDGDGVAAFTTIYPGWYEGRTTHVHLKVFNGTRPVLTSQLFLPDALSEYLYTNLPAYRRASLRDTLNRGDGIALEAGDAAFGAVREQTGRYVVTATVVVDPYARPKPERRPPPGRNDSQARPEPPGGGVRPGFQLGNQGGGLRGSIGLGGDLGGGPRGGGGSGDQPDGSRDRPGPPPDGPAPFGNGRGGPSVVLRGDARVAAIVPGGVATP